MAVTMKAAASWAGLALLAAVIGTVVSGDPPWEWNIFRIPEIVEHYLGDDPDSTAAPSGTTSSAPAAVTPLPAGLPVAGESVQSDQPPTTSADAVSEPAAQSAAAVESIATPAEAPHDQRTAAAAAEQGPADQLVNRNAATAIPAAPQTTNAAPPPAETTAVTGAVFDIGSAGGIPAQVYFGQAGQASSSLPVQPFNLRPGIDPDRCVLVSALHDVPGTSASVWAVGFDYNTPQWGTAEEQPNAQVAQAGGAVHHEAITPPDSVQPGFSVPNGGAMIQVDGGDFVTTDGSYSLELQAVDGDLQTWLLNGQPVQCRA